MSFCCFKLAEGLSAVRGANPFSFPWWTRPSAGDFTQPCTPWVPTREVEGNLLFHETDNGSPGLLYFVGRRGSLFPLTLCSIYNPERWGLGPAEKPSSLRAWPLMSLQDAQPRLWAVGASGSQGENGVLPLTPRTPPPPGSIPVFSWPTKTEGTRVLTLWLHSLLMNSFCLGFIYVFLFFGLTRRHVGSSFPDDGCAPLNWKCGVLTIGPPGKSPFGLQTLPVMHLWFFKWHIKSGLLPWIPCLYVKLLLEMCAHAQLCPTLCDPKDCSPPGPLFLGCSRQDHWSGLPFPPPGDLPDSRIEPASPVSPALAGKFLTTEPPGKPRGSIYWPSNKWFTVVCAI